MRFEDNGGTELGVSVASKVDEDACRKHNRALGRSCCERCGCVALNTVAKLPVDAITESQHSRCFRSKKRTSLLSHFSEAFTWQHGYRLQEVHTSLLEFKRLLLGSKVFTCFVLVLFYAQVAPCKSIACSQAYMSLLETHSLASTQSHR